MRVEPAADDLLERVAIGMNLVPVPAAYALYGMTAGRVVGVAQRLGVMGRLLGGPATAGRLAEELELRVPGTRLLCENLAGLGILEQDGHTFSLPKRSRKWLDPESETYIGTWLEHSITYWEWYGDLERIVREGGSFEIHRQVFARLTSSFAYAVPQRTAPLAGHQSMLVTWEFSFDYCISLRFLF